MAFLTRYGTQYGQRTIRHGRVIYVSPTAQYSGIVSNITGAGGTSGTFGASDNNDGLSPERAVRTVTYAVNTLAQTGDTVVLLPGTHTTTAVLAPRAGVAIFGSGAGGGEGRGNPYVTETILTTSGSNHLFNIAANNIEIGYLQLRPITAFSTIAAFTGAAGGSISAASSTVGTNITGFYMHDFYIDLVTPAISLLTAGIDLAKRNAQAGENYATSAATFYGFVENGTIWSGGAQGPGIRTATAALHVRNVRFHNVDGAWASPFCVATNTDGTVIDSCIFTSSGTMSVCIEGKASRLFDAVTIVNCRFPRVGQVALPVDNFQVTAGANVIENYIGGSGTVVALS